MLPHQGLLTNDVRWRKFQRCRRCRRRPRNCPVPRGLSRRGPSLYCAGVSGEVAEWLKALAWKACIRETVSWVRIPPSPPTPFPKPLSGALEPRRKALLAAICASISAPPYLRGRPDAFSRALFLQTSVLSAKATVLGKPQKSVLCTRYHAPDLEGRSLGRARREND